MGTMILKTKQMMHDAGEACSKLYVKAAVALATALSAVPVIGAAAQEQGGGGTNPFSTIAEKEVNTNDILGTIFTIVRYAAVVLGALLVIIGAVQFAGAFRNEDAEGKTKASHVVIAGIILLGIGTAVIAVVKTAIGLP